MSLQLKLQLRQSQVVQEDLGRMIVRTKDLQVDLQVDLQDHRPVDHLQAPDQDLAQDPPDLQDLQDLPI